VPVFAQIFEGAGMSLPTPTLIVLTISEVLQSYIHLMILGAIALGLAGGRYHKTNSGGLAIGKLLLKMPVVGLLVRKAAVARFTRTLGTLVASGVSILDGLEITARTAGNRVVQDAVMRSRMSIAG